MSARNNDVQLASFSYKIYINKKLLDDNRMKNILDITVMDNSTGSDLLQISMCDPDLYFISDSIITEKSPITFEATYSSSTGVKSSLKFEGYISIIDINFAEDGIPTMLISCMDNTYLMDAKPKKRTWEKAKRSNVASQIFKEYGFKTVIDATSKTEDSISQSNETDISFLSKLADEEGYLVYVEGNTGYFVKKPTKLTSQATLQYKEAPYDILGFSPRITKKETSDE